MSRSLSTIGVGIRGLGWVSGAHIGSYQKNPKSTVVALCSRSRTRAEEVARQAGLTDARFYTSYEEMLSDPNVQAVSLCTRPDQHPRETILAARAGKHILIEKSVANDPKSLGAMLRAVELAGVKTVVSFVLRWNPQFQWIEQMLARNVIGPLFYAEVDYWHHMVSPASPSHWNSKRQVSGSALLSAGCHAVDALRYLVKDEIVEVTAYANQVTRFYEYPTNVVGIVKFANGAIGKTCTSFDANCPYTFNVDLLGEKGTIRDNRIYAADYFAGSRGWITVPTVRPDSGDVAHHPFDGEISHFLDCILNDTESHVNLADAAKTHAVCYALDRSVAEGRPVRLKEIVSEMA